MDRIYDVLVIGGGQAGLGMGHRLRAAGLDFTILDAGLETGHSWRDRWDSLELFTPRSFSSLPGHPLPASTPEYPGKDHIASYLRQYRDHFSLPVQHGQRVEQLVHTSSGFAAITDTGRFRAHQVVLATGPYAEPRIPEAAAGLADSVWQVHTRDYRRPDQLPDGPVLVVGGGNSAAQITEELAASHDVHLASSGPLRYAPRTVAGFSTFQLLQWSGLLRSAADSVVARRIRARSDVILGGDLRRLISRGVVRHVPHRVVDARGDTVTFADASRRSFAAVVWCTGWRPHYPWLHVEGALDEDGVPVQHGGESPVPGLYWLGLPWQRRLDSAIIHGIADDSEHLSTRIQAHRGRTG